MNIPKDQNHLETVNPGGLYIHIPFCVRKCPYCDFYSITDLTQRKPFITSLLKEIKSVSAPSFPFNTLYIGGGTPSLMDLFDIDRILQTVDRCFNLLSGSEITIEVNPGTVDRRKLEDLQRMGINRMNIGIQSFRPDLLHFLGRIHSEQDSHLILETARSVGFEKLGVDLIYGIPSQSKQHWLADLETAIRFHPEHLSCYMLTYEPHTPLDKDRCAGRFIPSDDETMADLFKTTVRFLNENGYDPYEISNFEKSDPTGNHINRSVHNQKYWTYGSYLGFGPSAHTFIEPVRHWNIPDVANYIKHIESGQSPSAGEEVLRRDQQMIEWIYLGLRQTDGIPINAFNHKFNVDFYSIFKDEIALLDESDLITIHPESCSLTLSGMLLLDSIVARLISSIKE